MRKFGSLLILLSLINLFSLEKQKFARLHFDGGGDWYNDADIIPNLVDYINPILHTDFSREQEIVRAGEAKLFQYPFVFMTGHGNVEFNEKERQNLQEYLSRGGFLLIDDDYGMDDSIRRQLQVIFPDKKLTELPANHELFQCYYNFNNGLPKIHKHDDKRPQAYALFDENGRIIVLYFFESNITDGWSNMHNDPPEIRNEALRFGVNLLYYVMTRM